MKLVIAVVQDQDVSGLLEAVTAARLNATKLASTGGFLREGNSTILIGVEKDRLDEALDIVKETCRTRQQLIAPLSSVGRSVGAFVTTPVEVPAGGATIFVLDVERFEKV